MNTKHNPGRHEIVELLLSKKDGMRRMGAKRLGLFGFYVRNRQTDSSDIDLLIEFEKGKKTYEYFIELVYYLEGLLNRRVELVTQ